MFSAVEVSGGFAILLFGSDSASFYTQQGVFVKEQIVNRSLV